MNGLLRFLEKENAEKITEMIEDNFKVETVLVCKECRCKIRSFGVSMSGNDVTGEGYRCSSTANHDDYFGYVEAIEIPKEEFDREESIRNREASLELVKEQATSDFWNFYRKMTKLRKSKYNRKCHACFSELNAGDKAMRMGYNKMRSYSPSLVCEDCVEELEITEKQAEEH